MKDPSKSAGSFFLFYAVMALSLILLFSEGVSVSALEGAPPSDNGNKIDIVADKLVFERENNFAQFSGNVKASEKDTILTADTMKIYFNDQAAKSQDKMPNSRNIKEIHASGNVKITFDDSTAISENARYSIVDNVLVLTGKDTRITRGGNAITGEKITIYRTDGRISVEGSQQNRVRAEFFPQEGSKTEPQ